MNQTISTTQPATTPDESPLEFWGGIECTVVRLRDSYRNQIDETGHADRIEDLDAIAALGIKALRYPVLWETIAPEHPDILHWDWHDERLPVWYITAAALATPICLTQNSRSYWQSMRSGSRHVTLGSTCSRLLMSR